MIPKPIIKTKDELDSLLSLLNTVSSCVYKDVKVDISSLKKQYEKYSWCEDFVDLISKIDKETDEGILKELKSLEDEFKKLEKVRLSLSFIPSFDFTEKTYVILKKSLKIDFVIDVVVEENILSGAKLFYMGKYIDLTARSRVINLLKSENVLGKYL